ncbi:glycosyl hydrolase [Halanaerobium saccharolyticum]|uniref:glycosyl hydrolase n=1 Tax=Halanaerobium saccharolyticum TaxID=43595 RepID=UPI003FCE3E86
MDKLTIISLILLIMFFSTSVIAVEPTKIIRTEPINSEASKEVRAVLNYLHTINGDKMLSGQMESTWVDGPNYELEYINKHTGKQPAIRGLDFIHEKDNQNVVNRAIEWWQKGGIPTIMWHWGAPTIGEGYENSKKEINIDQVLTEGTKEYKAMISDLDRIANYLKQLKNANVPIIWRPMHEHNGSWFWWSKGGPEKFNKLWRFMYNYFAEEKGLNNLIWFLGFADNVDEDWYPGDKYVDLSGADTYNVDSKPQKKMYNSVRDVVGLGEPVAYHECGVMPDPELSKKVNIDWVWFMTWHSDWLIDNNSIEHLKKVYNSEYVITLSELPNIMDYYITEKVETKIAKIYTMAKGNGKIKSSTNNTTVDKRTEVCFEAVANKGFEFTKWSGNINGQQNPIKINANDDIKIIAHFKAAANTNLLSNGDFSDGLTGWSSYIFENEGAKAELKTDKEKAKINIQNPGKEKYHVQLIHSNIKLEKGIKYNLTFDIYSDSERKFFVKVGEQGGDYLMYFGDDSIEISHNKKTIKRTFTMEEADDPDARIEFNVGLEKPNVYIDNVSLKRVEN